MSMKIASRQNRLCIYLSGCIPFSYCNSPMHLRIRLHFLYVRLSLSFLSHHQQRTITSKQKTQNKNWQETTSKKQEKQKSKQHTTNKNNKQQTLTLIAQTSLLSITILQNPRRRQARFFPLMLFLVMFNFYSSPCYNFSNLSL